MSSAADIAMDRMESRKPFIRFDRAVEEDKAASLKAGHYVGKDVDYALVTAPYSKDVFKQKAVRYLEELQIKVNSGEFPREWFKDYQDAYNAFKNGQELPVKGTPIRGWGVISPAMQETLIRMNILTVEVLADMNDEGATRIGMGAIELKHKASAWLAQINDKGKITMEMADLKRENTILKSSLDALTKQVEMLRNSSQSAVYEEEPAGTVGISASDIIEDDSKSEIEALRAEYLAKTGKQPHHLWKLSTLKEKLAEA